mmetsp:Transcript_933/g.1909  ORF Transcript_933/g.1909 Transcript_933/m.1909 type:complete len:400 (-) Transcript_933:2020-3219(-)
MSFNDIAKWSPQWKELGRKRNLGFDEFLAIFFREPIDEAFSNIGIQHCRLVVFLGTKGSTQVHDNGRQIQRNLFLLERQAKDAIPQHENNIAALCVSSMSSNALRNLDNRVKLLTVVSNRKLGQTPKLSSLERQAKVELFSPHLLVGWLFRDIDTILLQNFQPCIHRLIVFWFAFHVGKLRTELVLAGLGVGQHYLNQFITSFTVTQSVFTLEKVVVHLQDQRVDLLVPPVRIIQSIHPTFKKSHSVGETTLGHCNFSNLQVELGDSKIVGHFPRNRIEMARRTKEHPIVLRRLFVSIVKLLGYEHDGQAQQKVIPYVTFGDGLTRRFPNPIVRKLEFARHNLVRLMIAAILIVMARSSQNGRRRRQARGIRQDETFLKRLSEEFEDLGLVQFQVLRGE